MDSSIVVPDAMPILFPFEAVADTDVKKRMESAGLVCRVHVKGREIKYTPNPVYCLCLLKECLKEDLPDQPGLISYAPSQSFHFDIFVLAAFFYFSYCGYFL
jgi:hypothetical protein